MLALHEASGLPVVLRLHARSPAPERRRTDARALAVLAGLRIVPLYEHIEIDFDGGVGVATVREYVEGASVRALLRRGLPHVSSLTLLRTGLLALAEAHEQGVTHRGYKPENLLVEADGRARVADFATIPPPPGPPDEPTGYREDDVRAAFAVFVESVVGPKGGAGKLPRRLRALTEPAVRGDGAALLESVEHTGPSGWGPDWVSRGDLELAGLVGKVR
jgi:serine/threonine-protein kinase